MLLSSVFILPVLAGVCLPMIRFTTTRWEITPGKTLALAWTGASDPVNIDLLKLADEELTCTSELARGHEGNGTFMWTPGFDLVTGDYVFYVDDGLSSDKSPAISYYGHSLQNNIARNVSNDDTEGDQGNDRLAPGVAAGIGVGSTLGGILLLGLVALLIHRGRLSKTRSEDQEAGPQKTGKQKQKGVPTGPHGALREVI